MDSKLLILTKGLKLIGLQSLRFEIATAKLINYAKMKELKPNVHGPLHNS